MLLNFILFLFFFTIASVLFFSISRRSRWILLLCSTYFFYVSSQPGYPVLIPLLTLINDFASVQMEKEPILFYGLPTLSILFPVGLSFYFFIRLSYAINVYRGAQVPERHLDLRGLHLAFFPHLNQRSSSISNSRGGL